MNCSDSAGRVADLSATRLDVVAAQIEKHEVLGDGLLSSSGEKNGIEGGVVPRA